MQKNQNHTQQLDDEEALIISPIIDDPDVISLDELQQLEDNPSADVDGNTTTPIDVSDAKTVFGHMPNPESDDDTLDTAHQLGIGLDDDEENPQELNLARDIDLAEKAHRDQ